MAFDAHFVPNGRYCITPFNADKVGVLDIAFAAASLERSGGPDTFPDITVTSLNNRKSGMPGREGANRHILLFFLIPGLCCTFRFNYLRFLTKSVVFRLQ